MITYAACLVLTGGREEGGVVTRHDGKAESRTQVILSQQYTRRKSMNKRIYQREGRRENYKTYIISFLLLCCLSSPVHSRLIPAGFTTGFYYSCSDSAPLETGRVGSSQVSRVKSSPRKYISK